MKAAVVTYCTIHLKGEDAGKLIGKNQKITKIYWPMVLEKALNSEERVAFGRLEQQILSVRHNMVAHMNGAETRPIASLDGIGALKVAIDWSALNVPLWAGGVGKLVKAVTDVELKIEVPKSEWAPPMAMAGPGYSVSAPSAGSKSNE